MNGNKNVIIFGANGQDGFYLSRLFNGKGFNTIGVSRRGNWHHGDVLSYELVENLIKSYKPAYVIHLAANSTTEHYAVFDNHNAISTGTINILEAVKRNSKKTKVFITGSGLQFENYGRPISENDEFRASSPYALARIHSAYAARYYRSFNLKIYIGYLFHHESPLRNKENISLKIAAAAKKAASGSMEKISIGDISVQKEWTYAKDTAKGIITLVEQDDIFEAVIGSGITYSIKEWLALCFGLAGKNWQDYVCLKREFKAEYKILVSNPFTIKMLGWKPAVPIKKLAEMMVLNPKRTDFYG